ncbi:BQ2448_3696 [Microbotryum intermedium]|uniref:BQ2448_3696 protein n=1 Tax=Microbotryum intermedium TaxID=269621 RepID=A0A238FGC6_9BASI|nr:BQ2448_3696 [Microbotryum intermedium]
MVATLRLDGRVCIITGELLPISFSGIGLETALVFAQEGAHVVCADINQQAAERAVELIKTQVSDSKEALAVIVDCGKEQQIKDMVVKAVEKFGRLDVIFNNAGIMHPADDHALNTEERIWDLTMTINLKGVWWGCKYAIEAMRKNPGGSKGSIINTASFVALMGAATPQIAYTASKGAVLAMTRELAMVHAREGIRLNNLCPGPLQTELLMSFLDTPEKKERRMVHIPMGRFGEAIEQAKAALFLASDDSSFITGTDFKVDGGIHACYVTPNGEQSLAAPKNAAPRA